MNENGITLLIIKKMSFNLKYKRLIKIQKGFLVSLNFYFNLINNLLIKFFYLIIDNCLNKKTVIFISIKSFLLRYLLFQFLINSFFIKVNSFLSFFIKSSYSDIITENIINCLTFLFISVQ